MGCGNRHGLEYMSHHNRRRVLVTGCSKGLGRALAVELLGRGCIVFALVRDEQSAEELLAFSSDCVRPIVVDVTSDVVHEAISKTLSSHGGILDALVNNAGIPGHVHSIDDNPEQDVASLLDVHCLGVLRVTRAALPFLRRSESPLVVNVTSRLGSVRRTSAGDFANQRFSYSYRIAKAAQNMLTLCLNEELQPQGVIVSAIHPGRLATDSASPGASMNARDGALRLADWISTASSSVAGQYRDLESGYSEW